MAYHNEKEDYSRYFLMIQYSNILGVREADGVINTVIVIAGAQRSLQSMNKTMRPSIFKSRWWAS